MAAALLFRRTVPLTTAAGTAGRSRTGQLHAPLRVGASVRSLVTGPVSDNVYTEVDDDGFGTIKITREKVYNTLSDVVIQDLRNAVEFMHAQKGLRGVFLKSNGKLFSAGADLTWMKRTAQYTREQNLEDAVKLSEMLARFGTIPTATIALVQGNAFGGGVGLVSVCDIAVAVNTANFTLSEVKLGIIPATISPYVVSKIGANNARRYFLTAETFDAARAKEMGLLQEVVSNVDELAAKEKHFRTALTIAAPTAVAASKALVYAVAGQPITQALIHDTATRLCDQRSSPEGLEGLTAFLEKRKAKWNTVA